MADPDDLTGWLYFYVAFDWGDEVNLQEASRLAPGAALDLSRRPRTPTSIAYKPPPMRFPLGAAALGVPGAAPLPVESAEATVFDFGAVSAGFKYPFRAGRGELTALAGRLADRDAKGSLVQTACETLTPLFEKLRPAVLRPQWNRDLWEEYFVFHFPPGSPLLPDAALADAGWLAGLLRLEDQPLSDQEAAEAVRLTLRYGRATCSCRTGRPACCSTMNKGVRRPCKSSSSPICNCWNTGTSTAGSTPAWRGRRS